MLLNASQLSFPMRPRRITFQPRTAFLFIHGGSWENAFIQPVVVHNPASVTNLSAPHGGGLTVAHTPQIPGSRAAGLSLWEGCLCRHL